jgi:uncharacterized protein (TIGR02677 family)
MTEAPGRLRAFAYVNADKAPLYRAVMRVFIEAKGRFTLHLRPADVAAALAAVELSEPVDVAGVEAALASLREWGNLEAHPDTADVATVEEFYRPRYLFQLTPEGEAAERALAAYEAALGQRGELQSAALSDIRSLLGELAALGGTPEPDEAKVHRTLRALRDRFDELTSRAQAFMSSLQRTIDLQGVDVPKFLAYKETLIGYLERFIGELVIAAADIGATIRRIEERGIDTLLRMAAGRDLADALEPTPADHAAAYAGWQARWGGLRSWFIGRPEAPAQAEVLRARARASIPALLLAVAGIHDRRVTRSDRSTDLRTLARWFAEADSDASAHRLWRAAFGLAPARHLMIDASTLDEREARPVPAATSWLEAPPLRISPRLRASGRHVRRGRPNDVIDRSDEKALLAAAAADEARQIMAARRRLATGDRVRLSDLGTLDPAEFALFLDLLGDALSVKVGIAEAVQVMSSDGTMHVRLEPTADGRTATVDTLTGRFSGPDHYVTIEDLVGSSLAR